METNNEVTNEQIETLRTEAGQHGDISMRITCDMALVGEDSQRDDDCLDEDGLPDYSGGGHSVGELRAIRKALRLSQDDARAKCARVIADAQADDPETYEASLSDALDWAATAESGEYLVHYEDTGLTDAEDPGRRCGYDDSELDAIRKALRNRDLTLAADDRGLLAKAVRS